MTPVPTPERIAIMRACDDKQRDYGLRRTFCRCVAPRDLDRRDICPHVAARLQPQTTETVL
jgi:hypothetical protein